LRCKNKSLFRISLSSRKIQKSSENCEKRGGISSDISTSFEQFAADFWILQQNTEILNRLSKFDYASIARFLIFQLYHPGRILSIDLLDCDIMKK